MENLNHKVLGLVAVVVVVVVVAVGVVAVPRRFTHHINLANS